mmetsp:Transcript_11477/g.16556  ORF Transcript_11477/g.16556 Transcript_11477/m.16556 type:complete len:241 (-) Transcript_11477:672-1394(-)
MEEQVCTPEVSFPREGTVHFGRAVSAQLKRQTATASIRDLEVVLRIMTTQKTENDFDLEEPCCCDNHAAPSTNWSTGCQPSAWCESCALAGWVESRQRPSLDRASHGVTGLGRVLRVIYIRKRLRTLGSWFILLEWSVLNFGHVVVIIIVVILVVKIAKVDIIDVIIRVIFICIASFIFMNSTGFLLCTRFGLICSGFGISQSVRVELFVVGRIAVVLLPQNPRVQRRLVHLVVVRVYKF